ncbi:hypothetical protein NCCP2716_27430 [Sporosarcina sp. NCCP-2716]|uniref:hypothetical protein n=1 Tax=Sporosarcina sp. NCCP-2716 TaxID=2943679 RepID=UPI00203B86E6|nr:hypothetical protein [Sporosarcina sp. NCCP-2716]GKV70245.1 hypothetical protein NCCP2716_27430 [Sporosarcina sp. NCCP-2716]
MTKEQLIDLLILTAGSWNATGQTDQRLERQFDSYLTQLQKMTGTDREGAMQILLTSQNEKGAAA